MQELNNDTIVIHRVQQGEIQMFNLLVTKYQYKLISVIRQYVKDEHDAAEVCQEAFLRAYRALDSFRQESSFYTWLYRIGVNCAKNFLRAKKSSLQLSDEDRDDTEVHEFEGKTRSPEQDILSDEVMHIIHNVIEEMPAELQQAIKLREIDGLSYEDIANIASCPVGTVRSRIFRARSIIDTRVQHIFQTATET